MMENFSLGCRERFYFLEVRVTQRSMVDLRVVNMLVVDCQV